MKNAALLALLAVCSLFVTSGIAGQGAVTPSPPAEQPPPPAVVASFLGLAEGQAEQFARLLNQFQVNVRGLEEQIMARQRQLEGLLKESDPNLTAIGRLVVETHALSRQMAQAMSRFQELFVGLLNEEQKGRLQAAAQAAQLQPVVGALAALHLVPLAGPR